MALFKKSRKSASEKQDRSSSDESDPTYLSKSQVKRATRTRTIWSILSSVFLALTVIFLIVAEVGDTSTSNGSSRIYFISLNLRNVVPQSFPNGALLNSIAQTLGLHDFYTVGLWGYCEGYLDRGITSCSKPQTLYWFNPVEIISSQLLAGASIQLPSDITRVLDIIRLASRVMFAFFLAGACLSFILIFLKPLMTFSRWAAFAIGFLGFLNTALILIATVVATVMFVIMKNVFEGNTDVNIEATLGNTMFAMIWIASAFALFSWIIDLCLMCCCASRRDVRRGKKRGNKKAYMSEMEKGRS